MREVSKNIYVIAFIITLGIFLLGMFLGLVVDTKRVDYVEGTKREQLVDFNSLQLQHQYLNTLKDTKNCQALSKTFDHALKALEQTRIRLENFDKHTQINQHEYDLLKREYMLAELKYMFLIKEFSQTCNTNTSIILYFFSDEEDCPKCDEQSFILTYLKKLFKDKLLNFAFDERLSDQEGMIAILKTTYEFYEYPSLVVNGEVISGFSSAEDLLAKICPRYKDQNLVDEIPQCSPFLNLTMAKETS